MVDVQGRVDCRVLPRFAPDPVLAFDAWVLPTITVHLSRCSLDPSIKEKYSSLALTDPDFHTSAPVDLLLGADVCATAMDGRRTVVDGITSDRLWFVFRVGINRACTPFNNTQFGFRFGFFDHLR